MKIITKAYLLIGVLIVVAIFNLFILYNTQASVTNESYSIIRAGDLKAKVETIAALAGSIASGSETDRDILEVEVSEFDTVLHALREGGKIRGQEITVIPDEVLGQYEEVRSSWEQYKNEALQIKESTIYNRDAVNAMNYILEKNTDMTLTTDSLVRDLEVLDRNYNRHKEIAAELHETAKKIGQNALLISIGEEEGARENLREARITFEIGMRKLLQVPLNDPDFVGANNEELIPIPRENSQSLDELDLLWEAVELRVRTLESESLYSEEFNKSFSKLNEQRHILTDSIDRMLDAWNAERIETRDQGQIVTQAVIVADIVIFVAVLFTIRKSLKPLERITNALSRVKEGIYGEKIEYTSSDEIGQLASTFNTMSETIKMKEEEARRTDIAKDEFLAMITHELKTPLVPIQGYADMLLGGYLGNLTEKQRERISIIKTSSASLLQLISDLLDVQKLELGQLRMKKEPSDIQATVIRSIQTLQPQIEEAKVTVTNDVKQHIIEHDSDRIAQVLTNLLKNSLKAVKPNEGTIRISSEENQDQIKIIIKDNGVGIPLEKQSKLFTKFYQADASLTREKGGSGLGLSICKGIVEAHGGSISLESSTSTGTTVTFSLPKTDVVKTPIRN
ncbi:ATP-binding protein [Candidatus Nitrosotenuis uzonensis]|uniref:histidine kinase n=1 Tax=Candidatus Nitrosotenuis uzonensis TaxID=1407055 RepID=V6ATG5_9ARCH|nr:ATP-binding protein [Candidatus Nitrosotenuis uzonensis]CDI05820.1 putative Histidine kinase [Candidatus Nitrosotenuis uzonensis]